MSFRIYKGDTLVTEGDSPLSITGLQPNIDISKGEYQIVRVKDDKESGRVDIPAFKTLPIKVVSVNLTPKTINAESGTADGANITANVQPSNATNKTVAYKIETTTDGLTVNSNGRVEWTENVPAGQYTISATTQDGNKTDTCILTLTEPDPEPEPEA